MSISYKDVRFVNKNCNNGLLVYQCPQGKVAKITRGFKFDGSNSGSINIQNGNSWNIEIGSMLSTNVNVSTGHAICFFGETELGYVNKIRGSHTWLSNPEGILNSFFLNGTYLEYLPRTSDIILFSGQRIFLKSSSASSAWVNFRVYEEDLVD